MTNMFRPYGYRYWIVVIICMDHMSAKSCKLNIKWDRDTSYFALHNISPICCWIVFFESPKAQGHVSPACLLVQSKIADVDVPITVCSLTCAGRHQFLIRLSISARITCKITPLYTHSQIATRKGSRTEKGKIVRILRVLHFASCETYSGFESVGLL